MPVSPRTHQPSRHSTPTYRAPTPERRLVTGRMYGRKWRAARLSFLADNPLCVECAKRNRIEGATDVDHVVPHKGDLILFWRRSNWQALCHECHSRKTASEDGGFGNKVTQ